jgi:uncharacterized repeat protein (TIGR03943 family)
VSRGTQNVLLLLVGLATGLMVVKGTYLHYVKPALLPWLVATALVLIALSLVAIVRDIRHGAGADGHRHRSWPVWLLLAPIALTAFVVPPPLGARGATPEVTAVNEPHRQAFAPLPAERAPTLSLPEVLMRAATDSAGTLDNRLITTTGFTMKAGDSTDLARVVIVCCAADAQLARIHLAPSGIAADYPEDTWLRVEGRVLPGTSQAATNFIPTLAVSSVTRVDKPANTYAY